MLYKMYKANCFIHWQRRAWQKQAWALEHGRDGPGHWAWADFAGSSGDHGGAGSSGCQGGAASLAIARYLVTDLLPVTIPTLCLL